MARPRSTTFPNVYHHKGSNQAAVVVNGRTIYLGTWSEPQVWSEAYENVKQIWLANNRTVPAGTLRRRNAAPPPLVVPAGRTIVELLALYDDHAQVYYGGSREYENLKDVMSTLRAYFGRLAVSAFTATALDELRRHMAAGTHLPGGKRTRALARTTINSRVGRVLRIFRWGVSRGLVEANKLVELEALESLRAGHCEARETAEVEPVSDDVIDATLPHLPAMVADMVRVQRLCGARPGEICSMKTSEIDRTGKMWVYRPAKHKNAFRKHTRSIPLGPKARAIIARHIRPALDAYVFSPRAARAEQYVQMRARRKTKVQPSQQNRKRRRPKVLPGECYTSNSYNNAVRRACKNGTIAHWHVHQIRHTVGTKVAEKFGQEAAQRVLGHKSAQSTARYVRPSEATAVRVIRQIG